MPSILADTNSHFYAAYYFIGNVDISQLSMSC